MKAIITVAVGAVLIVLLVVALCVVPLWFLWNWIMPDIFGLKEITLIQSAGLILLCSILFKPTYSTKSKS